MSIKDVAREAAVSVGTVSNVLNHPERVAASTVERVSRVIDRLGFVRNDAARQLRAGRSHSIGLVVLDGRNPFFADLAAGAQREALAHGYSVVTGSSDDSREQEAELLRLFQEQRVTGILISPVGADLRQLWQIRDSGTPIVLVDRGSGDRSFSSVSVDDVEGGRIAVRHLLEIGRRRIAFVGGPLDLQQVAQRIEGAREILAGRADATLRVFPTAEPTVLEGRRIGAEIAALAPRERPDAVFAANDLLALGLLQALVMQDGIRVPEDIALVGYDDIDFAESAVVPITSISQSSADIGAKAVELLIGDERADGGRAQFEFQPMLVPRASTLGR